MDHAKRAGELLVKKAKEPEYDIKLHFALPSVGYGYKGFDLSDVENRIILSQIERNQGVRILDDVTGVSLTILAPDKSAAQGAREAIEKILRRTPAETNIWRSWVLLKPPMDGGPMNIILQRLGGAVRPTATSEPRLTADGNSHGDGTSPTVPSPTQHKGELKKILTPMVENLRNVPNRMRMRVQFGSLQLKQWRKEKVDYTLAEVEDLAGRAALRGNCGFESLIGDEKTVNRLRTLLSDTDDIIPLAVGGVNSTEIKPNCSIILVTKNLSMESAIEALRAKGRAKDNAIGPTAYTFSPLQVFNREKSNRAVEIMTSCPENRYDWEIEIQSQVGVTKTPFGPDDMTKNVIFTNKDLAEGFPGFKLTRQFIETHEIEQILGKCSWTYGPHLKPYKIEISMYHVWGTNTTLKPTTGAGLTMYGEDWDYDMDLQDLTSGPRDWESFSRFLDAKHGLGEGMDEYDDFLALIHRLQGFLDEAVRGVAGEK